MNNAISSFLLSKGAIPPKTAMYPKPNPNKGNINININININKLFPKIYVINLKRRKDRLSKMKATMKHLHIKVEIFSAVDGSLNEEYKPTKHLKSCGEYGYLLTWKNMIEDAKAHNYESFLSFDDDIICCKDFHNRFSHWVNQVFHDQIHTKDNTTTIDGWKVIHLGATQLPKLRSEILDGFYRPKQTDGSYAVAVHNSVYDLLLEEINKMEKPLDSGPLRTIYKMYPKECYVAHPHLVIADVSDSDIRECKDLYKVAKQLEWDLDDFI